MTSTRWLVWGELNPGETVLDLGSGAGFDSLLAAAMVGPTGHVTGVDYTAFCESYLESLPVEDDTVDVVISNGVVNLCPDKAAVLAEAHRVLKPGGRMQLADIVVAHNVGDEARSDISLWTG